MAGAQDDVTDLMAGSHYAHPGPARMADRARVVVNRVRRFREGGMVAAVLVTGLVFTIMDSTFISIGNLANISDQISYLGLLAVGMTFVLIAGEIDLSIGSIVGLAGVVFGLLLEHQVNLWAAVVLTLGAGCLMGATNGILSVGLGVPTIIVTLGMQNVFRGIAYLMSNGYPLENFDTSSSFFLVAQDRLWNVIPYTAIILVVFALLSAIVLRRTVVGHRIYAMGSNLRAAQLSGIHVWRIRIGVLVFLGFAGALSGLLTVSETQQANPNTGIGYELTAIAAVIIGGAKLTGGSGTVLGSFLGIVLLGEIQNGLVLVGVSIYVQVVVSGAIVVVAVAVDRFLTQRSGGKRKSWFFKPRQPSGNIGGEMAKGP
jgi:ribose transport system permease protein